MNENREKIRLIALTGILTALTYVLSAFLHVPTIK